MINYIEYLKMPAQVAFWIVAAFFAMQLIGEILEFKGKVVPEFLKVRKYFARRRKERETLKQLPETLAKVTELLTNVDRHYSTDNISQRNKWIEGVNQKLQQNDDCIRELNRKLDKNNADTLSLVIEGKRNAIISFASYVADGNNIVTREQFRRVLKTYDEYEDILEENGMTNGETEVAIRIIREAYEVHMHNHTFLEDIRGYNK